MSMESESSNPHNETTEGDSSFYSSFVHTGPYSLPTTPPLPPPPPEQKKKASWLGVASLCVIGLLLTGVILYVGIAGIPWQQTSPSSSQVAIPSPVSTLAPTATFIPTPAPTPTPSPTPTLAVQIIPASQIVTYFYQIGLAPQYPNLDTSWSCCQYYPEGGAVYWNDLQTGTTMDLATFDNIQEAQTDAQNLESQGFGVNVINYCLLSYSGNPSDLQSYIVTMQGECIYKQ